MPSWIELAAALAADTPVAPTLYQQGGYWYGRYKKPDEEPRRKCLGNATKVSERAATAKLLAWVAELEEGQTPAVTLYEFKRPLERRLHATVDEFARFCDPTKVEDVRQFTLNDVLAFQASLEGKVQTNTVRKKMRELRRAFNAAVEAGDLDHNPTDSKLIKTTHQAKAPKVVNIDESLFELVLSHLPTDQWRAAVASAYYLGLRRGEVFDAKLAFLDRNKMSLDVFAGKTKRLRIVRVEPEFMKFLYPLKDGREELTLPRLHNYNMAGAVLKDACLEAGGKRRVFTWSDMRRNRATLWRRAGHPASAVNQWMGHREQTATDHYVGELGVDC